MELFLLPDDYQADYRANERVHGTAMASLILHGDLSAEGPMLSASLPSTDAETRQGDWNARRVERVPSDELVVDLIHAAVIRMLEDHGDEAASAPDVTIVNLSIGIRDRPFERALSPLARLLDWLAWRYQILFLVSAGNHDGPITLDISRADYRALDAPTRQSAVVRALAADARNRRLLSPAEAVNALTVGAMNDDQGRANARPGG